MCWDALLKQRVMHLDDLGCMRFKNCVIVCKGIMPMIDSTSTPVDVFHTLLETLTCLIPLTCTNRYRKATEQEQQCCQELLVWPL